MPQKLLLVGWDGADWALAQPLMDAGRMPQTKHMLDHGISGILRSSPPYLSPILWTTIATGKSPAEHGVVGFREYDEASQAMKPVSSRSRQCKAIWNMLSQEGWKTHVLGWFASAPAESLNGVMVSELFGTLSKEAKQGKPAPGIVSPQEKAEDLLTLAVAPEDIDPALLKFFIPRLEEINLERDPRPLHLRRRLAELYSYHNAAVTLLQEEGTDFLGIYYHFLDWICHDFMTLAPPQRPEVSERDFALYSGVLDAGYALQDLLLRDLLRYAGQGTNCLVVSDHGFLSGDARPARTPKVAAGIAAWHRPEGMIFGAGPMFRSGINGLDVRQVDLVPTILHAAGLPVGGDMPGRVLTPILTRDAAVKTIPSWEDYGPAVEKPEAASGDANLSSELLKQFEAMGYVPPADERQELAESRTRRENAWNLGMVLMGEGRFEEALPCLEEAFFHNPESAHIAHPLARCQIRLGLIEESLATEQALRDYGPWQAQLQYYLAILHRMREDYETALHHIGEARTCGHDPRQTSLEEGLILLHLGRFKEADAAFRGIPRHQPDLTADLGLCRALVMGGQYEEGEARTRALLEAYPAVGMGWFTLGQILEKTGRVEDAKTAYEHATAVAPFLKEAKAKNLSMEGKLANIEDRFSPLFFDDFDFAESPIEKKRRVQAERISRIREASRERHRQWQSERDHQRSAELPVKILDNRKKTEKPVVVVSGLPRSGTSMMMEMLQCGGLSLQTDGKREADAHNPRGFFEWEPTKTLGEHPRRIDEAVGKAVKIVSNQLQFLPRSHAYSIIWMDRPLAEVARSQLRMRGEDTEDEEALEHSKQLLRHHRQEMLNTLRRYSRDSASRLRLVEVSYADCLENPETVQEKLSEFLGDLLPSPEKMQDAVDSALYRNRVVKNAESS